MKLRLRLLELKICEIIDDAYCALINGLIKFCAKIYYKMKIDNNERSNYT